MDFTQSQYKRIADFLGDIAKGIFIAIFIGQASFTTFPEMAIFFLKFFFALVVFATSLRYDRLSKRGRSL